MNKLEAKYAPMYSGWKTSPNPDTMRELLAAVQPEIDRGTRAHVGGTTSPLLAGSARRLAVKAIQSYDPAQAALGTHIVNNLQGLKRLSRQQNQIMRVPERAALEQQQLQRARVELEDRLGRDPSLAELSGYSGVSLRRIKSLGRYRPVLAEGTVSRNSEQAGGGGSPTVEISGASRDGWIHELLYADLNPINQKIMEWSLGLHGQPMLENREIARRLQLSPGAISQRKQQIQAWYDQLHNAKVF